MGKFTSSSPKLYTLLINQSQLSIFGRPDEDFRKLSNYILILCGLWIPIAFIPWISFLRWQRRTARKSCERQKREIELLLEAHEKDGLRKRSGSRSVSVYGVTAPMFDCAAKGFLFFLGFLAIGISFSKSDLTTKVVGVGASVFEL
jgi:hypothetical protein